MKYLAIIISLALALPSYGQKLIENLPAASSVADADTTYVKQGIVTKKATIGLLRQILATQVTDSTTIGQLLMKFPTPVGPVYLRINSNGTVTSLDAAGLRADLALVPGTDVQAYNAKLASIALTTFAADTTNYFTSSSAVASTPLTSFARTILDDTTQAAVRITLGLTPGTDVQAYNANLATLAAQSTTGMLSRTGTNTYATRDIVGTGTNITITNGSGAAGNPTIDVGTNIPKIASNNTWAANQTWASGPNTFRGTTPLAFDGATTDANAISFSFTDPTASRTITFRDQSGTNALEENVLIKSQNGVKYVATNQTATNTATMVDSTDLQVSLPPGTYWIETLELVGSSAYATAGTRANLTTSGGSATWSAGRVDRGGVNGTDPVNGVAPTWGGPTQVINNATLFPTQSQKVVRSGVLTVTATTTVKVQFCQYTAVASETATLIAGSYLKHQRID